jgi:hypothetical protein
MFLTALAADFLDIIAPDVVENGTSFTATVRALSDAAHSLPLSVGLLPYSAFRSHRELRTTSPSIHGA